MLKNNIIPTVYTVLNMMKTVLFNRYRDLIIEESSSDVFPTFDANVCLDDSQHCIDDPILI